MIRLVFFLLALAALPLLAEDETPLAISIQSSDTATTYALGTIKNRALVWSDSTKTLSAVVTFVDEQASNAQAAEDSHRFRLPGITYDTAHGIFYATSATGELVPIAKRTKTFLFSTINVLPNAIVRVHHPHGNVTVTLEAIRPGDLAHVQKQQDSGDNPEHTHTVNLEDILPH